MAVQMPAHVLQGVGQLQFLNLSHHILVNFVNFVINELEN